MRPGPLSILSLISIVILGAPAISSSRDESADVEATVDAYVSAWNETDEGKRRTMLEGAWSDAGIYSDPSAHVKGREALIQHIAGFHRQLPGASLARTSTVDRHHDKLRFTWEMMNDKGEPVAEGVDYGELGDDGRLVAITGFFGPVERLP